MWLIRRSHNSKCVQRNDGKADDSTKIKIINEWNGKRAPFYLLIGSFLAYLADQNIKEIKRHRQYLNYKFHDNRSNITIPWIETLLQTLLADYRKYCIWRILTPYLVNIRKLSYDGTFEIINDWLNDCSKIYRLDFSPKTKIDEGLKGPSEGYYPIMLEKLREENKVLYDIVVNRAERIKSTT